jgi:hypothetical protein
LVLLEDQTTGATIDGVTLTAAGTFSVTTAFLPAAAAPYNVIAHYGGDGNFSASDSTPISMMVAKVNSQVLVNFVGFNGTTPVLSTSAQSVAYGSPYILRVDVENASGTPTPCQAVATGAVSFPCPTGTIQLLSNGNPLNDFPNAQTPNASSMAKLNDRGFAEDQPIQLAPGAYNITATYTADANSSYNSSSTSNTLAVTITKAATTTKVVPSPASIAAGGSVTLTATVNTTSNGAGPSGTVQFMNGSAALGSATTCTPTTGTASSTGAAFCTATLTTTLSQMVPLTRPQPRMRIPFVPVWIAALMALLFFVLAQRVTGPRLQRRLGYAAAGLLLLACVTAGIAGCSGSGGGGGGGTHTDNITAVYAGDGNYTGSTSAAAPVTVQ